MAVQVEDVKAEQFAVTVKGRRQQSCDVKTFSTGDLCKLRSAGGFAAVFWACPQNEHVLCCYHRLLIQKIYAVILKSHNPTVATNTPLGTN